MFKLKKRGQESVSPLVYVLISVVVILLGYWGVSKFYSSSKQVDDAELVVMSNSLSKMMLTNSEDIGNVESLSISVPNQIKEVCFVDRQKGFNELINAELTVAFKMYEDSTLFLKTQDSFKTFKIKGITLEKESNPLCVIPSNGKISIKLENMGEYKDLSSDNKKISEQCTVVEYNGNPKDKLDFVFIGSNYDTLDEFSVDVDKYYTELKQSEPFISMNDKINFFKVDDIKSIECTTDQLVRCDEIAINTLASQCPNDLVILLHKDSLLSQTRSSSIRNIVKVALNMNTENNVILHELGHGIGNLADEYVDDDYYSKVNFNTNNYPNCDNEQCLKWNNLGCYEGCSLSKYFRPTSNSIMRSLSTKEFGEVNDKAMKEKLAVYK